MVIQSVLVGIASAVALAADATLRDALATAPGMVALLVVVVPPIALAGAGVMLLRGLGRPRAFGAVVFAFGVEIGILAFHALVVGLSPFDWSQPSAYGAAIVFIPLIGALFTEGFGNRLAFAPAQRGGVA